MKINKKVLLIMGLLALFALVCYQLYVLAHMPKKEIVTDVIPQMVGAC